MIVLRKRKLKNGEVSLYLDIHKDGKRSFEFLNLRLTSNKSVNKETMELAKNILAKRQLEIQSTAHGITPTFKRKYNFVEYYYNSMPEKDRINKKNYHSGYVQLYKFTKGFIQISAIDENWIENFQNHLLKSLSINSTLKYLDYLKAIFHKAVRERIIGTNPFVYFHSKIKLTEVRKDYLLIDELELLVKTKCIRENVKDAFIFSCYTGLRLSDVRRLTWKDIEGRKINFKQKKTSSYEYLPTSDTADKILNIYRKKKYDNIESNIFDLPSQQTISVTLKQWTKDAGINKNITFHNARHTFATMALTNGVDIYTLSKLLGQKSTRPTQTYTKVVDLVKIEAVNKLPVINLG